MQEKFFKEAPGLLPDVNNAQHPSSWQPSQLSFSAFQPVTLKPNISIMRSATLPGRQDIIISKNNSCLQGR